MAEPSNKSNPRRGISHRIVGFYRSGNGSPQYLNTVSALTWTDQFSGSKVPGYKDRIKRVVSATSPASGFRRTLESKAASGRYVYYVSANKTVANRRNGVVDAYNYLITDVNTRIPLNPPSETTAENQAIARLQQRLIAMESSAASGEDLGEISQTVRMLKRPMRSVQRLAVDLLSGHERALSMRSVSRAAKALGDVTLEYRFGIQPIVKTLADGLVGLQNRDYMAHYMPFYATGEHTLAKSDTLVETAFVRRFIVSMSRTRQERVRYMGVWGVRTGLDKRSVSDVLRLRMRDVIPTVWNLIPYSWLVDYVTNIGDIAESISVPWNGVRWCVRTRITEDTSSASNGDWVRDSSLFYPEGTLSPGYIKTTTRSIVRSAVTSQPRPSFEIDLDLSGRQMTNIAALLLTKIPIIGNLTQKAVRRNPSLPAAYAAEVGRRNIRSPYPFHY